MTYEVIQLSAYPARVVWAVRDATGAVVRTFTGTAHPEDEARAWAARAGQGADRAPENAWEPNTSESAADRGRNARHGGNPLRS